jgi:hypothetical protein
MTKKAKFPAWTTKKVGSFLSNGKVRKDANLCKLPLHLCMRISTLFFSLAFQAWESQNVLLLKLLFSRYFEGMLVIAQGGLGWLKPKEGPLY